MTTIDPAPLKKPQKFIWSQGDFERVARETTAVADGLAVAAGVFRVVRPGGTVAMANLTPDSFPGRAFDVQARALALPDDTPRPMLWGVEEMAREWLRPHAAAVPSARASTCPRRNSFSNHGSTPSGCEVRRPGVYGATAHRARREGGVHPSR